MSDYIKNQATITYNDGITTTTEVVVTDVKLYDDLNLAMADYKILEAYIEADHKVVDYEILDKLGDYTGSRVVFDIGTLSANTEIVLTYTIILKNDAAYGKG